MQDEKTSSLMHYSDIFINFCQDFLYKERVGRWINIFICFQMAIKIPGSTLHIRVGRVGETQVCFRP